MARAEADLRALIERLAAAGDQSVTRDAQRQLASIQALRSQVAMANLLTLISLRGDVAANVASAGTVVKQGQGLADRAAAAAELAHADAEARQSVAGFMDDYYKKKIFDPYLRFTSKEDEEAFRERERERQAAIAGAQAKGTPEGDLEASRLALAQLDDAGAHGADRSPKFQQRHDELNATLTALETAQDRQKAVTAAVDPLNLVAPAPAGVDPAVIASLQRAGLKSSPEGADVSPPDVRSASMARLPS